MQVISKGAYSRVCTHMSANVHTEMSRLKIPSHPVLDDVDSSRGARPVKTQVAMGRTAFGHLEKVCRHITSEPRSCVYAQFA